MRQNVIVQFAWRIRRNLRTGRPAVPPASEPKWRWWLKSSAYVLDDEARGRPRSSIIHDARARFWKFNRHVANNIRGLKHGIIGVWGEGVLVEGPERNLREFRSMSVLEDFIHPVH